MKKYYVYIITNKVKTVLYVGVTSNLWWRVNQHKNKLIEGFTSRYNINKLVYYEEFQYVNDAIKREKQLKNWRRQWKFDLIRRDNPYFDDITSDWYQVERC